jgi:hypothetical protein
MSDNDANAFKGDRGELSNFDDLSKSPDDTWKLLKVSCAFQISNQKKILRVHSKF